MLPIGRCFWLLPIWVTIIWTYSNLRASLKTLCPEGNKILWVGWVGVVGQATAHLSACYLNRSTSKGQDNPVSRAPSLSWLLIHVLGLASLLIGMGEGQRKMRVSMLARVQGNRPPLEDHVAINKPTKKKKSLNTCIATDPAISLLQMYFKDIFKDI